MLLERAVAALESIAEAMGRMTNTTFEVSSELSEDTVKELLNTATPPVPAVTGPTAPPPAAPPAPGPTAPPPAAPPAPGPTAPPPAAPPASGPVELDKDGYPWDERIHTKAKTKMMNGTWKLARNVDKTLVEQVRAEWKTAPPPAAPPVPGPTAPPPAAPPVPGPTAPPPAAPPVPPAPGAITFPALVKMIQDAGYTGETLAPVLSNYGLTALPQLAHPNNAALIQTIATDLGLA